MLFVKRFPKFPVILVLILISILVYSDTQEEYTREKIEALLKNSLNNPSSETKIKNLFFRLFESTFTKSAITSDIFFNRGNVGIGTSNPKSRLEVNGQAIVGGNNGVQLVVKGASESQQGGQIMMYNTTEGATSSKKILRISYGGAFQIANSDNKKALFTLTDDGRLSVGSNSYYPDYTLDVLGDINARGNIRSFGSVITSDIRYKKNITELKNPLDKLLALHGVQFEWKAEKIDNLIQSVQIGFIGQEVEKILPELVETDKNGYKSVAYHGLTALFVEAAKELNRIISRNTNDIDTLKKENTLLKEKVSMLENDLKQSKLDFHKQIELQNQQYSELLKLLKSK